MRPWKLVIACLSVAGAAVALAACGGAPDNQTPVAAGFEAYLGCLRQNGVTVPSASPGPRRTGFPSGRPSADPSRFGGGGFGGGGFGGGFLGTAAPAGVDPATWEKAMQACAALRPTGNPSRGAGNSALIAYRNCLSEHGVTATNGPLNSADPTVAAAEKACEPLRPTRPATTPTP